MEKTKQLTVTFNPLKKDYPNSKNFLEKSQKFNL